MASDVSSILIGIVASTTAFLGIDLVFHNSLASINRYFLRYPTYTVPYPWSRPSFSVILSVYLASLQSQHYRNYTGLIQSRS